MGSRKEGPRGTPAAEEEDGGHRAAGPGLGGVRSRSIVPGGGARGARRGWKVEGAGWEGGTWGHPSPPRAVGSKAGRGHTVEGGTGAAAVSGVEPGPCG